MEHLQPWLKASAGGWMLWETLHQDEANEDHEWQSQDGPGGITRWQRTHAMSLANPTEG